MKLEQLCNYDNIETALSICNIDYTRIDKRELEVIIIFYSVENYTKLRELLIPFNKKSINVDFIEKSINVNFIKKDYTRTEYRLFSWQNYSIYNNCYVIIIDK